jgi:hypothetical protein
MRFVETLEKGEALLDELLTSCVAAAGTRTVRRSVCFAPRACLR